MKGIVADFTAGTHVENGLARRLNGPAVDVGVGESPGLRFFGIGSSGSQVHGEFLPHHGLCVQRDLSTRSEAFALHTRDSRYIHRLTDVWS